MSLCMYNWESYYMINGYLKMLLWLCLPSLTTGYKPCISMLIYRQVSFVKAVGEGNNNKDSNPCPSEHWYDEVPELVILLLLFLFALTLYRKWEAKKRTKAIRRALGFGQQSLPHIALQNVSSQGGDLAWRGMGAGRLDWCSHILYLDSHTDHWTNTKLCTISFHFHWHND